jgi:hypothetical protein
MRALPHHPDGPTFQSLRESIPGLIESQWAENEKQFKKSNGRYFAWHAELHFIRAEIDYLFEAPPATVVAGVRQGLRHARTAFDLGHHSTGWHVWDYTLFSLASTFRSMAHFMASLPLSAWWESPIKPVPWLLARNRCVFALLREDPAAGPLLKELEEALFRRELPPELEKDLPDLQNTWRLLQALLSRDAAAFNKGLALREELRAQAFSVGNQTAPVALLDLHGLGLCRLARDFEMPLEAGSPYLPFDLLDA